MQSVGGPSQPEGSVCSAYSVGIFMFSHRFQGSAQMVRLCRFSHGIHGIHRITCCEESPTESTDLTEVRVRYWLRGFDRDAIPS